MRSDFNPCFCTQENCTRTISFFLYTYVNCAKWKICMGEGEAALKLHESFWGALPYLSHLIVHLSHLLYFLFKVSRESKPQQLVPSLAQVDYFYPVMNALTSLFLMDQWLSWSLLPSCKPNCVCTECIFKSQPSDLLSFLTPTFSSVEGSWKKTQWKNKGCTFTSEGLSWHRKYCHASVSKVKSACTRKNISQFMLSFPYSFFTMMAEGMRLCPSPGNVAARWTTKLLRRGT